jgi:GTP-binding protein EngB required for normal cell division
VSEPEPGPGPRTAALLRRVAELAGVLERGGDRIPHRTAAAVGGTLESVRGRLELGVDHTLVALAGGTGSGKSSVFNAISRLRFADVGARRPTTSQVTACVWAHDADDVLDWLGVPLDRRIERESELDGESQADLRGLVLLDMPDHDSVEPEHRAVVDRVLPQVDLLVWVVDPQKYADDVLHSNYIRRLAGHEGAMLVLLNQMDTIPLSGQASVLRDMDRLLREDGLDGVAVYGVSAKTGEGLPMIRDVLARVVAARGVAERRAAAEMNDAVRALATAVGAEEPDIGAAAEGAVTGLIAAAGVPETAAAVRAAVRGGGAAPGLGPLQADRVTEVCRSWPELAAAGLPPAWRTGVTERVADADRLRAVADEELAAVEISASRPLAVRLLRAAALVLGAAGLALAVLGGVVVIGDRAVTELARTAGVAAGGAVLGALLALGLAVAARRGSARRRARAVDDAARHVLAKVVDDLLVRPTVEVLEDHRAVREATHRVEPHVEGDVLGDVVPALSTAGGPRAGSTA